MPENPIDIELLKAIAALRHYPYPERAALWAERLAFNARDLATLRAAPDVAEPPLVLPRRPPRQSRGDRAEQRAARKRLMTSPRQAPRPLPAQCARGNSRR